MNVRLVKKINNMANITNKNAEDLWKAIKRLHKENGTYGKFTRLRIISARRKILSGATSMSTITNKILVPYCWSVFKMKFMTEGNGEIKSSILASIHLLSIIDYLKSKDTLVIKEYIANGEFQYIGRRISTFINFNAKYVPVLQENDKMDAELKEKINEALTKYAKFIEKGLYKHIITSLQMMRETYRAH
jgi:hypothetical protein